MVLIADSHMAGSIVALRLCYQFSQALLSACSVPSTENLHLGYQKILMTWNQFSLDAISVTRERISAVWTNVAGVKCVIRIGA